MAKKYNSLNEHDVRKCLALRQLHEAYDRLDDSCAEVLALNCAINNMHYALQKSAEERNLDPEIVNELMGGPGTKWP